MTTSRSSGDIRRYPHPVISRQIGLTLIELMISMALGLLVVLSATTLLVSSKSAYVGQDSGAHIQDTARYAMETISRAIRQASYVNWDKEDAPITLLDVMSANIAGLDATTLSSTSADISTPITGTSVVNGSDVLALRFFGTGAAGAPDFTTINCAGFGISPPVSQNTADQDRGWSIFYVANDVNSGEPELRCKYYPDSGGAWKSESIATGIESFQVVYGVDTTGTDRLVDRFLTATQITALDNALVLVGADAAEKAKDKNRKTYWKKVLVVKVSLLARGAESARSDALTNEYDLFGKEYSTANGASDTGTVIKEVLLPVATRNRMRKVFSSTIQFRNASEGDGK